MNVEQIQSGSTTLSMSAMASNVGLDDQQFFVRCLFIAFFTHFASNFSSRIKRSVYLHTHTPEEIQFY